MMTFHLPRPASPQLRARVLAEVLAGRWSVDQAATALHLSVRQVWRLKTAYVQTGPTALLHGNTGRPATTRITAAVRARVVELVRGPYAGCNDSHLVDLLGLREEILLSRSTLRRILRDAGLAAVRQRRAPKHRRRRDREPQAGMLLQTDGSRHQWFGPDGPYATLSGLIDDATSAVVAAVFRDQEDAQGYLLILRDVVQHEGVPLALYHDRHTIFRAPPGTTRSLADELAGVYPPTQFGAALEALGIASIAARSPQAKGRIERLWGTLQDRLVQELRLAGITTLPEANRFLPAFLERHNQRFATLADDPGRAYQPVPAGVDLDVVFSFRYPRVVAADNTVTWHGQTLQLPPGPNRRSYARAHVWVHESIDGWLGVRYENEWLLRTTPPDTVPVLRTRRRVPPTAPAPAPARPSPLSSAPPTPRAPGPPRPAPTHPWRQSYKKLPDRHHLR